jgi:hypothetical protein
MRSEALQSQGFIVSSCFDFVPCCLPAVMHPADKAAYPWLRLPTERIPPEFRHFYARNYQRLFGR